MTFRNLARVGATGLLAAGSLAFGAVPAFAADVDFGINFTGTTIAADASGKLGFATVSNEGTTKPSKVEVLVNVKDLDPAKVTVDLDDCTVSDDVARCAVASKDIPIAGASTKLRVPLIKRAGASGAAGRLTVTVRVDGDTNPDNDSKTVDVSIGGHGVDMTVVTRDVYQWVPEFELASTKPILPGGQGTLEAAICNQGDAVADGVKIDVSLPEGATIAQDKPGCTVARDRRSATCTYDWSMVPERMDPKGYNWNSGIVIIVSVSKDVKGPVALKGGEVTVTAINQHEFTEASAESPTGEASAVPKDHPGPTAPSAGCCSSDVGPAASDEIKAIDVDGTDNADTFAVLVAGQRAGSSGGTGGGEDNGGLPVTGPVAASVAGVGGAVIIVGAALFFAARRRRVVMVTPSEDK